MQNKLKIALASLVMALGMTGAAMAKETTTCTRVKYKDWTVERCTTVKD